ncbi:hypothetical protein LCM4573_16595 [Rhizobium sp. LCM 4573]|nr:hypothetical protein LCM4573_16595 [Rhizobium sp. LCM 4573]
MRHVFYAEVISNCQLLGTDQFILAPPEVDFDRYDSDVYVPLDDFESFECLGADDLPGYVAVTFFKIIGGRKLWLRSYLYSPSGYISDFATPSEALQAARAHREHDPSREGCCRWIGMRMRVLRLRQAADCQKWR